MIFKSAVSYVLGVIAGAFMLIGFINSNLILPTVIVSITFTISQIISKKIKNNMKNKYYETLDK